MPLRIPAPKTLSDLLINVDKDWAGKNITNLGSGAFDLNAKFSDIPGTIASILTDHDKATHDALGIAPAAHKASHEPGGADEVRGIDVPSVPGADNTGHGIESTKTVGENVDPGEVLYKKDDGKYWLADADAAASMPAVVMAMETILADAAGRVLHIGPFRHDAWDWTVGNGEANLLFADVTPGAMVQLAGKPSGTGDQVQVLGYVETADSVFFNPSYELVEVS